MGIDGGVYEPLEWLIIGCCDTAGVTDQLDSFFYSSCVCMCLSVCSQKEKHIDKGSHVYYQERKKQTADTLITIYKE